MKPATAPEPWTLRLAAAYRSVVVLLALAVPAGAFAYLLSLREVGVFEHHVFHVGVITLGNLVALATAYVAWRNHRATGEPALRMMTVAFLGFALVYLWHGFLTPFAPQNAVLFLAYGPTARLVFVLYLLAAVAMAGAPAESEAARRRGWWPHLALLGAVDLGVFVAAASGVPMSGFRMLEIGALVASVLVGGAFLLQRKRAFGFMPTLAASLLLTAQASLGFILSKPWNHVWWFAHLTFAAGFLLLGVGMVRSYLTTRSLQHVFSERELFARLHERTAELEDANARLRAANDSLAGTNAALESFSYVVAHDLKEPVRALDAYLGAALEAQDAGETRELVGRARDANTRLSALLRGLLEMSRASRIDPEQCHPVWVPQAIESVECRERYGAALAERGGRLEVAALLGTPPVCATTPALSQILGNLIVNAIRHNPKVSPRVRVRAEPADAEGTLVRVVVEDDGDGFASSAVALFNERAPRSLREGGFGLLIVRRSVEGLRGSVTLGRSDELGGAAVSIVLPAASGEAERQAPRLDEASARRNASTP